MNPATELIRKLREHTDDPECLKAADDLQAMDLVMEAWTGEPDEGRPPTLNWHNAGLEIFIDLIIDSENMIALDLMSRGDLQGLSETRKSHMELLFKIGYELGKGEYNIKECHCK